MILVYQVHLADGKAVQTRDYDDVRYDSELNMIPRACLHILLRAPEVIGVASTATEARACAAMI